MKNNKKLMVITWIVSLLVSSFSPIHADVESETVTSLLSDNGQYVYKINEDDRNFTILIDVNDGVVIDGDKKYSLDDYIEEVNLFPEKGVADILKNLSYSVLEKEFELTDIKQNNTFLLRTPPLPSTGYGSYYYLGDYTRSNVTLSLATAAVTLVATFIFGGSSVLATSFIKAAIKKAIVAGAVAAGATFMVGDLKYEKYQAINTIDSRACREKRKPYVKIGKHKIYDSEYVFDFWATKPW